MLHRLVAYLMSDEGEAQVNRLIERVCGWIIGLCVLGMVALFIYQFMRSI